MTHPRQRAGQSFDEHQAEMAAWLGVSVEVMNSTHDETHAALCLWLGMESQALRYANGQRLTPEERMTAGMEEDAVLAIQRLAFKSGCPLPERLAWLRETAHDSR